LGKYACQAFPGKTASVNQPSVNFFGRQSTPTMSIYLAAIVIEACMSITMKVSACAMEGVNSPRQRPYLWTTVLIFGMIAACAIAGSFYVGGPGIDASLLGRNLLGAI
jgi:hypothetical protein